MKKPEWIFVIVLILVGAYFSYRYFAKPEKFVPLQMVPRSAVIVYETKDPLEIVSSLYESDHWQDLKSIDAVATASGVINNIDSLVSKNPSWEKALVNNPILVSLHVTGSESSGFMYFIPEGNGTRELLEELLQNYAGTAVVKYGSREYEGVMVHQLKAQEIEISFINYKNYLIISTYGYLVEDVIRNINAELADNFTNSNSELLQVPKLEDDDGNLYLNGPLLTTYFNTLLPALQPVANELSKSLFLDMSLSAEELFLSGFLFEKKQNDFAGVFKDQEAGTPGTLRLVPENAALVMTLSLSDVEQWYEKWNAIFPVNSTDTGSGNDFIKYTQGDLTLMTFSSNIKDKKDKLLIVKLSDKEGMLNFLNRKAETIATQKSDSVYFEQYANHTIGLIDKGEFVSEIFGSPFEGFSTSYFMLYDNYLVIGTSAERIKKWLADIEDDYVWGRLPEKNSFINEKLKEVSFAVILNNPRYWSLARDGFNKKHMNWWQKNEKALKQFGMAYYQFTNLDNRFYSEANIIHQPQMVETGQQVLEDVYLSQLTNSLMVKPKLVKNHNNGSWETFVQDSSMQILLISNQGEILWQDSLNAKIATEIYQIDYYKNRKLQYLFATDSAIHVIDRNGQYVSGYPAAVSGGKIKHLTLIDYDHSKNYRFLITDHTGNLKMFDQKMNNLEGWDPLALKSKISDQVYHVRVRGKDRIVVGLENGIIDLKNRRSEEQKGFPFDLAYNLTSPLHFEVGSTFESARFTTVSSDGMIAEFDLNGKMYARNQLYQPSGTVEFTMVLDPAQNEYIIARQDYNRLALITSKGDVIFEKDYQSGNLLDVQYYSLGVDKQLYIVRDTIEGALYLYNKDGSLINVDELYSDYPVSVIYRQSQAKCYIYSAFDQSLEVRSFEY
ncbi:MAG: hypothetical protein ABFS32_01210 [Bacteroidota bacterium]